MDNRQANINRFEAEMTKVTRDGVDKLMAFIRKSDMYAAPASTRFHLSVRSEERRVGKECRSRWSPYH